MTSWGSHDRGRSDSCVTPRISSHQPCSTTVSIAPEVIEAMRGLDVFTDDERFSVQFNPDFPSLRFPSEVSNESESGDLTAVQHWRFEDRSKSLSPMSPVEKRAAPIPRPPGVYRRRPRRSRIDKCTVAKQRRSVGDLCRLVAARLVHVACTITPSQPQRYRLSHAPFHDTYLNTRRSRLALMPVLLRTFWNGVVHGLLDPLVLLWEMRLRSLRIPTYFRRRQAF
ncbi:hypothetical protein JKF63_03066 [Porcisia hertigi]|uniref:Uncharacterized protein n=1 Tax=Porcisia hertigi TaxID=2761500 RepID=A0A836HEZ0_9TRYP|nr:hypothetical protein JKF63_03066 [Porcisia hertigi]